jgi:DNA-binding CsgD family transcriptional regulator
MSPYAECVECGHLGSRHRKDGAIFVCDWGGGKCKCAGLVVQLTPREYDVLKLLAAGNTIRSAAVALNLSWHTVEAHRYNMGVKTGLRTKLDLVTMALRIGLLKLEDLPVSEARVTVRS